MFDNRQIPFKDFCGLFKKKQGLRSFKEMRIPTPNFQDRVNQLYDDIDMI